MIRSFADKMKYKQEAYEAEQKVLAEQAEQARLIEEERIWEQGQLLQQEKINAIVNEYNYEKEQKYLDWKQKQKIIQEQQETLSEPIDTGLGIGHQDTWILSWKSFSTHPDIINLPMSEKIRLFKIAERKQIDKLNYYANLNNDIGSGEYYWEDGVVQDSDFVYESGADIIISEDVTWTNSVDVNTQITIAEGTTLTVIGILTINGTLINNGTLIVNGIILKQDNLTNNGTLIVQ